jgi:hypothetical protein
MIRSMEEFTSAFQAARCVSTPLVAIRTADPASTTHFITETLKHGQPLYDTAVLVMGNTDDHGNPPSSWDSGGKQSC